MAVIITDDNFDELVLKADKLVLLDFWAEWCSPCKMISPVIEELHLVYKDVAVIAKLMQSKTPGFRKSTASVIYPPCFFLKTAKL